MIVLVINNQLYIINYILKLCMITTHKHNAHKIYAQEFIISRLSINTRMYVSSITLVYDFQFFVLRH